MGRITNYQIAYLLSLKTHREKYPVVRWIESCIESGTANLDFGDKCSEVIDEVVVSYGTSEVSYGVREGKVICIFVGQRAEGFIEDLSNPGKEEIDMIELCDPRHHMWLRLLCKNIEEILQKPHSCKINYQVREEKCSLCGKWLGPVNYFDGVTWKTHCGGSSRCCP